MRNPSWWAALLAAAAALICAPPAAASTQLRNKTHLTIGYLMAAKGTMNDRQGLSISGALTLALAQINDDPDILPDVHLDMVWNDTLGETVKATRALTDMLCDGVVAFFGPEGSCDVEAIVTQARNKPMISYKCSDHRASSVPTFVRTQPPDTQVTKSVISLLKYYSWTKFSIVYEKYWENVALSLEDQAKNNSMKINHKKLWVDKHICCRDNMTCCQGSYSYQFVTETKNETRIYVFLGSPVSLVDIMQAMHAAQLFEDGHYMVIYVDMNEYSDKESKRYLWKPDEVNTYSNCTNHQWDFYKRGRSLFVIVSTPPMQNYQDFIQNVSTYNAQEPFKFQTSKFFHSHNYTKYISIYAAYLYDSVQLYTKALDQLLKEQSTRTNITEDIIREIANNGTKIVETIIKNRTYKSVTGATIKLDNNGDSEGNFSVLALQKSEFREVNFTCDYHLTPVGQFYYGEGELPQFKLKANTKIDWQSNNIPLAEPTCGFSGELCHKPDSQFNSIVSASVLAALLFCATVITMSIYRKWKIEQEIEGLLWKINADDIKGYFGHDIVPSPSKTSITSVGSYESRCGPQVFAQTGQYRGLVVRIKELKFSKKKDISRDIMKEMRIMRDLRHDNINSFIGACVEPMRILLVTDYCAKGSLYDIIENEDIKLDNMFIASLVHDLIKGMLYIHNSLLVYHGNLKSSNCVVTSRWMLQITDFGLHEIRHCAENDSIGEHQYYRNLFWKAPELLRSHNPVQGTQKGDVYAFAIILYEICGRKGPFGTTREPKEIIDLVKQTPQEDEEPFRPAIDLLYDSEYKCGEYLISCMKECWHEIPDLRPDFATVRTRLKMMNEGGKRRNIMDQMINMLEKYANNLEDLVNERTRLLFEEKQKTEDLLHRMLPEPVAKKLTTGQGVEPESFDQCTIYFSDIVGFTAMSAESTPLQVVNFLNDLYTVFDRIIKGYDVYKVETIGDAYMVVSGLPLRNGDNHAGEVASMALDLLDAVKSHCIAHRPNETLKLRIGMHTGPVVAGVVGLTMPRYCLFGDTVNTASRMESNGEPLKIHISPQCKEALDRIGGYTIEERGLVYMKGKGELMTFWLVGATERAIQRRNVDFGDLPPLFCRPRRSPKLNMDSRQPSLADSCSLQMRRTISKRIDTAPLYITYDISKTLNDDFSSDSDLNITLRQRQVTNKKTCDTSCLPEELTQNHSNLIRESRSLDMFPILKNKNFEIPRKTVKRSFTSLENCKQIPATENSNYANGNVVTVSKEADSVSDDVEVPLLRQPSLYNDITILPQRGGPDDVDQLLLQSAKRWRSSEDIPRPNDLIDNSKIMYRNPIRSFLAGLFNGNGLRTSDTSIRKGVLPTYNDIQAEKESIV